MAQEGNFTSPGKLRTTFLEEMRQQERATHRRTIKAVQEMANAMSGGVEFTTEDFMFVATNGQPKKFPEEASTLRKAAALEPGQTVGLIADEKLQAIGIVGEKPLGMEVRVSQHAAGDISWTAGAVVNFVSYSKRNPNGHRATQTNVTLQTEPAPIEIMRGWGKNDLDDRTEPFLDHTKTLIVGIDAMLDHIAPNDDPVTRKQVSDYLLHITGVA